MNKLSELSIFFPFWNEEKNIRQVIERAVPVADKIAKDWEIIVINDGSSDNTLKIANELSKKDKRIKVISHYPNRGYGSSLKEGFTNASYEYVVFTDGDGQFDFSEVDRFIDKLPESDLVIGYRQERRDNLVRHVLMNLLKIWDYIFFGINYKDIDCGFKMFKKSAIEELMPLRSEGAMITTEILAKAKKKRLKVAQVGVSHYPRQYGAQSGANLWVISRAILESLILWMDLRNGRF